MTKPAKPKSGPGRRKPRMIGSRDKTSMWPAPADTGSPKRDWSVTHTWERPDWTIDELVAAKDGRTVSVVLPALNEEDTVADVIASIMPL